MAKKNSAECAGPRSGPGRLSVEDTARLPDRLLDAALELFSERTYGDTTMEQIARRAGASTKTLYARYADKAQVVQAVINRLIERSLAVVAETVPLDPHKAEPRVFLITLGTRMVTGISREGAGLVQISLSESRRFPAIPKMYNDTLAMGRARFQRALEEWHAGGLLPDLKNPPMAAMALVSLLTDMARIRTAMGQPMSDAEIAAYIPYATDLFLKGCGYRPRS